MKKISSTISISTQLGKIRNKYPRFISRISRNTLLITGEIRPTPRSHLYSFSLEYKLNKNPRVSILSPILKRNKAGDKIPHMYFQKYLCLHQPKYKEFTSSNFLADTIIPWVSLWLYYYEMWHITDKWLGGGEHPKNKKVKK